MISTRTRTHVARPAWHSHAASEAQIGRIARDRARKLITPELAELLAAWDRSAALGTPSKGQASAVIDALVNADWAPRPEPTKPVDEDGQATDPAKWDCFIGADGRVIKVDVARGSGRLYAKVLDREAGVWEYTPGLRHLLAGARRMTLAEAVELSAHYERCVRCWQKLTLASSIAQSMGDRCASKFE